MVYNWRGTLTTNHSERLSEELIAPNSAVRVSINIWGCISNDCKLDLEDIEGGLAAHKYIDKILRPPVETHIDSHTFTDRSAYMQDGTPPHTARISREATNYYSNIIMSAMASRVICVSTVCWAICSSVDKKNIIVPRHWPLWGEPTGTHVNLNICIYKSIMYTWRNIMNIFKMIMYTCKIIMYTCILEYVYVQDNYIWYQFILTFLEQHTYITCIHIYFACIHV